MALGEDPTNRAEAAAPAADVAYQELLAIAVELTWFLLGALGPTTPIGVVIDIVMAVADEASTSSAPIHNPEGQRAVASPPAVTVAPLAVTVAASPVPPIPVTATTRDTSKSLADEIATVGYELATAVRTAATLDRILAADASDVARLLPVREQVAAAIDDLGIASSRHTAMPSTGPSPSPVVIHSPRDQPIGALPMPYQAVAEQPVVVATGRMVSAPSVSSSPATDHSRYAPAHDAYDPWSP